MATKPTGKPEPTVKPRWYAREYWGLPFLDLAIKSLLLPLAAYLITAHFTGRAERRERATAVIAACNRINGLALAVEAATLAFEEDVFVRNADFRAAQKDFRSHLYRLRAEFDHAAWWDFWQHEYDARVHGYVSKRRQTIIEGKASEINELLKATVDLWGETSYVYASKADSPGGV